MLGRRIGSPITKLLLALFVVSLIAGQVLGQPILLSYVETGSMEPTMEPGDGFVAVPSAVAGPVEEGDVIVFRSEEIQGGGLTTHRVVGETNQGYITKGDANPFTDQDGDEPPVKDAQIVAEALQIGGTVVVIPHVGTSVEAIRSATGGFQRWLAVTFGTRSLLGPQGLAYLLAGLSAAAYVLDFLLGSGSPTRTRTRERDDGTSTRLVLVGLVLLVVAPATAAMVIPAGTYGYGVVSADFQAEDPTIVPRGESSTVDYPVPNAGLVPVHVYLEPGSEGVTTDPEHVYVPGRGEQTARVTLHAPPETGYYRRFVVEHRYLALLPEPVINTLYRVHPWLPIAVIDTLLGGSIYLLGRSVVGRGRIRTRSRDGPSRFRRLANRFGLG
jgi:signal peptidase